MAVLGFPSCDSGSYTTPDVKGLLDKRRESFSQRFTKNQEEPSILWLLYLPPDALEIFTKGHKFILVSSECFLI